MKPGEISSGIQKQDAGVYEYLMKTYSRLMWTIAAGILNGTGNREDVEDVVSDVFLALWENPGQFDPQRGSIKTWLCLKTRSRAIDLLRKRCREDMSQEANFVLETIPSTETVSAEKTLQELEMSPASGEDSVLEQILSRQQMIRILEIIQTQESPDREILMLRLIYEIRPALIAAKLKIPVAEVYDRIRAGKKRLKKELEGMR